MYNTNFKMQKRTRGVKLIWKALVWKNNTLANRLWKNEISLDNFRFQKLRKAHALRLLFILSITDGVFAILSKIYEFFGFIKLFLAIPQIAYFVIKWNPIKLDYDPLFAVSANIPLTVQLKLNLIITLAIAIDRFQVLNIEVLSGT